MPVDVRPEPLIRIPLRMPRPFGTIATLNWTMTASSPNTQAFELTRQVHTRHRRPSPTTPIPTSAARAISLPPPSYACGRLLILAAPRVWRNTPLTLRRRHALTGVGRQIPHIGSPSRY